LQTEGAKMAIQAENGLNKGFFALNDVVVDTKIY